MIYNKSNVVIHQSIFIINKIKFIIKTYLKRNINTSFEYIIIFLNKKITSFIFLYNWISNYKHYYFLNMFLFIKIKTYLKSKFKKKKYTFSSELNNFLYLHNNKAIYLNKFLYKSCSTKIDRFLGKRITYFNSKIFDLKQHYFKWKHLI